MKKICKNCKCYEEKEYEKGFGKCSCEKFLNANKDYHKIYDENDNFIREKDTLEYWDYESYSCGFDVGEDFGCIHFKEKS